MKKLLLILALVIALPCVSADPIDLITNPVQRNFADTLIAEYDKFIIRQAQHSDMAIDDVYNLYFNQIGPQQLEGIVSLEYLYAPEIFTQWASDDLIFAKLPPIDPTMCDICTAIADQSGDVANAEFFYHVAISIEAAGDFCPSVVAMIVKESKPIRWTRAERYIVAATFLTKSMPTCMPYAPTVPKSE